MGRTNAEGDSRGLGFIHLLLSEKRGTKSHQGPVEGAVEEDGGEEEAEDGHGLVFGYSLHPLDCL